MKVKILNKALSSIIPRFVENFDQEVFVGFDKSHKFSQSDLLLKQDSLLSLGIPFHIDSGVIHDFSISIDQDESVLINISNIDVNCTIFENVIKSSHFQAVNSFKNKIIKKCISNFSFSFVFTNLKICLNSIFEILLPILNLNYVLKPNSLNENDNSSIPNDFVSCILNANDFKFSISNKTFLESSFVLSINLPFGDNHEKQLSIKTKEVNINFANEKMPYIISFIKSITNSILSQSSDYISSNNPNESNSSILSTPFDETDEDNINIIEINIDDILTWSFKLEFDSVLVQIEDESSRIIFSNCKINNDLFSISKISLINSVNIVNDKNSNDLIQYSLSFIDFIYNIKDISFDIRAIEDEGGNASNANNNNQTNLITFNQLNQNCHFLTSFRSKNKIDLNIAEIKFSGSFEAFFDWLLSQSKSIDMIFQFFIELSSNDNDIDFNSSSFFMETIENLDYSVESSTEVNQITMATGIRKSSSNVFSDFIKKINSKHHSICINFPLFEMNFNSGFNSHIGLRLFFSLRKKCYQIIGSDACLSFKQFEPIFTNLSFQVSVNKNYINALLSPSDLRFTEDEGLLMTYYIAKEMKTYFDRICQNIFSYKKLKMTIITFNLILCKNIFTQNDDGQFKKNSFLMLSSNDISLSAFSMKDKISIDFKCSPCLKFWNAKTSFWDFIINPFQSNIAFIYKNGFLHFDINISSPLEVNVVPYFVDYLLPKCDENNPGINLGKISLTNLTLNSMKSKKDEILQKFSNENESENELSNVEDLCCGSESVSVYNGLGAPIPINIISEFKTVKASSTPAFIKIENKDNIDESPLLNANTVTDEEHRKMKIEKKRNNSSVDLNCDNNDINGKQKNSQIANDETIVIDNEETKLLPNANYNSVIYFPSLNESIKISYIKDEYIIHNEIVIIASFNKESDQNYGKLIKLLPRFEIQNKTKYNLKIVLLDNNGTSKRAEKSPDLNNYCYSLQSNKRLPLNEIQCRKKIALVTEKTNINNISGKIYSYSSNLTDKSSNYNLVKLFINSDNNKKNIKKDNNLNHSNDEYNRENLLESFDYFLSSLIPNIYFYISEHSLLKLSLAFKLSNPVSPLNRVLEIRPLFVVRNDLPFDVVCTFLSGSKDSVTTVNATPNGTFELNDFNSNVYGIQFTALIISLGISKTIKTNCSGNYIPDNNNPPRSIFKSPKVTPFSHILQKEIITISSKNDPNNILMSFYLTFNYCETTGQFVFYLFSPIVIVNKTLINPLFINDGQRVLEFKQSNFPVGEDHKNEENFPTFTTNSTNYESLSISVSKEGPFVPLSEMSQFLNISAGNDLIYPFYIEFRKMNEFTTYLELRPRLSIINKMPFEINFTTKNKPKMKKFISNNSNEFSEFSFTVSPNESKTITKCRNDFSFSISPPGFPDLDDFIFQNPISTVFRFTNEEEEKIVHFQLDKNQNSKSSSYLSYSSYLAIFEPASICMPCPTMFVIVNNISNFPIHAQQCEDSMPIRISPNSTSLFPFDAPFSTPVVMITIAGKSQLIPLQNELKASLFPFKVGSEKIYADLIVLSPGKEEEKVPNPNRKTVQALIIGYQPFSIVKNNKTEKPPFLSNPEIEKYNFTFNLAISDLNVSFFTKGLEEFILVNAKLIQAELNSSQFNFSINSIQIDDQISFLRETVVFKSKSLISQYNPKMIRANSSPGSSPSFPAHSQSGLYSNSHSRIADLGEADAQGCNNSVGGSEVNNEDDDEVKSRMSRPFRTLYKDFIQVSIKFNFSLLNSESFEMLVQPFDVAFDPTFAEDFLVYFAGLLEGRRFLIPDGLVALQSFVIHPMRAYVFCREISKRKFHFCTESQGNDRASFRNDSPCNSIVLGTSLSSFLRNLLLFGFQPDKKCSVGFASLTCHDLNMRLSAFLDILGRHFGFFTKNALSYLTGARYTERPDVTFSLFQSSFVISEFYSVNNIQIETGNDSESGNDRVFKLDLNDPIEKVKINQLHASDVFPVFSCSPNMKIDYKTVHLFVQEPSTLLANAQSSISLIRGRDLSIDNNSNLSLFSATSSFSNYSFNLGNRISHQKLFVSNRIVPLTNELISIELLIKKSLKAEKIHFIDYCGTMSTVIAITDTLFFVYALPLFNLLSKFSLACIVDVKVSKNRVIMQMKKSNKWKSSEHVMLVDVVDEETAMQMKFVIQTQLIQQNNYV